MSPNTKNVPAVILFSFLVVSALPAQTGLIYTVAGTGQSGTGGIGGPATAADMSGRGGVAVDASDNLYIADSVYNRVLRVDAATGILTLVAGTGPNVSGGDNGPAVQASLATPYGVAFDPAGNLLIVEFQGARVRRVDALTGIITTIVGNGAAGFSGDGGPAAGASLNSPMAIAVDAAGNLYIADVGNARVRKVDAQSGYITTVAGNGVSAPSPDGTPALSASLMTPFGVSLDHWGGLLISEPLNGRIRGVNAIGNLNTLAGNGGTDFTGDGVLGRTAAIGRMGINVASDPGGNLYFPDGTGRIRRVDAFTGTITTVAGNGSGALGQLTSGGSGSGGCYNGPIGDSGPASVATVDGGFSIALTSNGNLVFSDWIDCRVRRVYLPSPYPYTNTVLSLSSGGTVTVNQPVTFTATVAPIGTGGSPSGTVQFVFRPPSGSPVLIGSAAVVNGTASMIVPGPSSAGAFPIIAYYSGDSSYNGSGSPVAVLTVNNSTGPSVVLTSSQNPVAANTPVTFTVTVAPPPGSNTQPTGSVELDLGTGSMGTATIVNGVAQFTVAFANTGNQAMSALYLGDANYPQTRSTILTETVNPAPTTTSLAAAPGSATYGQPVQLTATVAPASATGTVNFLDLNVTIGGVYMSSVSLGTSTLSGGTAVLSLSNLTAGTHTIKASYLGDSANAGSMSAIISVTIAQATPALTVSSSVNPSQLNQGVTFTATLTPVPVSQSGTLSILDGATPISGESTWTPGRVTVTTGTLTVGRHSITAVWSGDTEVAAGTSAVLTQTVQGATTLAVSAGAGPFPYGQPVTLTATVSPGAATGSVQFTDGTTSLGTATISGATASITIASLGGGTHQISASYGGDGVYLASSGVMSLTIDKAGTSVALSASPNPALTGQSVTFTAGVSPATATGSVQFLDGTTVLGTSALAGGTASFSTTTLVSGSHTITAVYNGDGNYSGSTSLAVTEVVKATSGTTIAADPVTPVYGQTVNLTAAVSPAAATGTVQFLDGTTPLGTAAVANGTAVLALSTLSTGSHAITAVYSGDGSYGSSASTPMALTIGKAAAAVTLTSSLNPSVAGQSVTFSVTVAPAFATGTVQFLDGATVMGSAALSNGAAVFATSSLAAGDHSITAKYLGDGNVSPSQSAPVLQQVTKHVTSTTLVSAPNPSTVGAAVTLTATVLPATATGTVQFLDGATVLGSAVLANGSAQIAVTSLPVGSNSLTAVYGGDAANEGSTSAVVVHTVNKAPTATTVSSSVNPSTVGQPVTFTATVAPGATGSVQFLDGVTPIGTVAVNSGVAALTTSSLPAGFQSIAAVYSGDANYSGSTGYVNQSVTKPTTTSLTSDKTSITYGQAVTFTATVSPSSVTGVVQFMDGTVLIGTAILSSGQAKLSTVSLSGGSHSVTAVYAGDATDGPSASASRIITVAPAKAAVNLVSSQNPIAVGQTVTFTVGIDAAVATGTVTFKDGSQVLGTVTLNMSTAAFSTSSLSGGNHSITAVYSGDINYLPATSNQIMERVR